MKLGHLLMLSGRMDGGSLEPETAPRLKIQGTGSGDQWWAGVLRDTRTPAHQFLWASESRLSALARSLFGPKPPPLRARHPLDITGRSQAGGHPDRFSRLFLLLLVALLALAAVACGFGAQEIRHEREKHQADARVRQAEQARHRADLACRQMHASLAVHLARVREQTALQLASHPLPAKAKTFISKS